MYGYDDGSYPTMAERFGGAFLRGGGGASPAAAGGMSELPAVAGAPSSGGLRDALHPSTGLFAVFAVAAVSFGLMAFSTTVRVGHAEAHAGVGHT